MEDDRPIKDRIDFIDFGWQLEPPLRSAVARDWGLCYQRLNHLDTAIAQFDQSIEDNPDGFQPRLEKTNCYLATARIADALASAGKCLATFPNRIKAENARNLCIYEDNEFENSLAECYNTKHRFNPKVAIPLMGPLIVTRSINQSIGSMAGPCLLNMRKPVQQYWDYKKNIKTDKRSLWKIRREAGECDVVSVDLKPSPYTGPLERKRSERKRKQIRSLYMDAETANDIEFLNRLRNDKRMMLVQTPGTAQTVTDTIDMHLGRVNVWQTQMWKRRPLYSLLRDDSGKSRIYKEANLNYIQYATRRDAFAQLARIKTEIRHNLDETLDYIDMIMCEFYAIKTNRVFPRKAEFVAEIYNLVGIAFIAKNFIIPVDLMLVPVAERLSHMCQVPAEKRREDESAGGKDLFGNREGFVDPNAPDTAYFEYKRRVRSFEKRLQQTKFLLEKCYLCYELSNLHIANRKLDEPKQLAVRMCEYARIANNPVWMLLSHLLSIRSDCVCVQHIKAGEKLRIMAESRELQIYDDNKVKEYVRTALAVHEIHMNRNKESINMEASRMSSR